MELMEFISVIHIIAMIIDLQIYAFQTHIIYTITVGQRSNDAKTVIEDKGFTQHEINFDDDVDFILYKQLQVSNFKVSKDDNRITVPSLFQSMIRG